MAMREFKDALEGAQDFSLDCDVGSQYGRKSRFEYVAYERRNTNAITLTLTLIRAAGKSYVIRQVTGFTGSDWFFGLSIPLLVSDKVRFETSGAAAGEVHSAVMIAEEVAV